MHPDLLRLFQERFGAVPVASPLDGDGSRRRMTRLRAGTTSAIGVEGPDPEENRAFLSFSRSFRAAGLPVPEVHAADEERGVYLVEDLGDLTLFRALVAARAREAGKGPASPAGFPPSMLAVYRRVIEALPRVQVVGGRVADYAVAYPRAAFDRPSMLWDLNYFKYHFVRLAHVPFNEDRLERDFQRLSDTLLHADASHFLYRDFQSRNVMLRPGASGDLEPWFIDYQGGRRGALAYDVASLLYDAKAEIPPATRDALLERYLDALARETPVDRDRFRAELPGFVLVRILQALGAYGYRGFYERKAHFLRSVPPAVRNLRRLLETDASLAALPELRAVLERIATDDRFAEPEPPTGPTLSVSVGSFRYGRGAPADASGHGGGFVFDCRGLENPGRDEALASLTGRDEAVARAVESSPGAEAFYGAARALVESHVRSFLARGFTSLQALFGCTGGRHRSVAMAERLARDLATAFPSIRVVLAHAEEPHWGAPPPSARGVSAATASLGAR